MVSTMRRPPAHQNYTASQTIPLIRLVFWRKPVWRTAVRRQLLGQSRVHPPRTMASRSLALQATCISSLVCLIVPFVMRRMIDCRRRSHDNFAATQALHRTANSARDAQLRQHRGSCGAVQDFLRQDGRESTVSYLFENFHGLTDVIVPMQSPGS